MEEHEPTTSETIYQTCLDLHNAGRRIMRQTLLELTGLGHRIVDDHVTRMVEVGRLRRVGNGVVEIVEQFPANRVFFKTVLPNGVTKLELGEQIIEATPSELRVIAMSLVGEANQLANIRGEREVHDLAARAERELRASNRQLADTRRRLEELTRKLARLEHAAQVELPLH